MNYKQHDYKQHDALYFIQSLKSNGFCFLKHLFQTQTFVSFNVQSVFKNITM